MLTALCIASLRIRCKPFLQCASVRIRETRERAWPGKSVNVVPDRFVVGMKLDSEAFFAYRRMIGQRAVRKTELLDRAASLRSYIQSCRHSATKNPGDGPPRQPLRRLNRNVRPTQLEPGHIEHFPLLDRVLSALKNSSADAQSHSIVIHDIASGRRDSRRADMLVREFSMRLRREERVIPTVSLLGLIVEADFFGGCASSAGSSQSRA